MSTSDAVQARPSTPVRGATLKRSREFSTSPRASVPTQRLRLNNESSGDVEDVQDRTFADNEPSGDVEDVQDQTSPDVTTLQTLTIFGFPREDFDELEFEHVNVIERHWRQTVPRIVLDSDQGSETFSLHDTGRMNKVIRDIELYKIVECIGLCSSENWSLLQERSQYPDLVQTVEKFQKDYRSCERYYILCSHRASFLCICSDDYCIILTCCNLAP